MRPLCAFILFATVTVLPGQDIVDLSWRETKEGLLQVQVGQRLTGSSNEGPRPTVAWKTMFPGLFTPWSEGNPSILGAFRVLPPFDALPLLLHGSGGAAALDESSRRLQKLGIRVSVELAAMRRVKPDALVDLLRVRYLANIGTHASVRVLIAYALNPARDSFVRAAAAEAVAKSGMAAEFTGGAKAASQDIDRQGVAGLHAGLARLPDDCDLVLALHCAALPPVTNMFAHWRRLQHLWLSSEIAELHGSVTPDRLVDAQLRMDQPGQLPYELAARFGNWRVDYSLFAVRGGAANSCWFHLAGVFQPERIAAGLRHAGIEEVSFENGEVQATVDGWHVRSTPFAFEAWQGDLANVTRGARTAKSIHRADPREAPIWGLVASGSRLGAAMGLGKAGLDFHFFPQQGTFTAIADTGGNLDAVALWKRWRKWQGERSLKTNWRFPNFFRQTLRQIEASPAGRNEGGKIALSWLRSVGAVEARVDSARVEWKLDVATRPIMDLVRLLKVDPVHLLEIRQQ